MASADSVKQIVAEELGCERDTLSLDSRFEEDLQADSLDRINLTLACESHFGIGIPDRDAEQLLTVGDLVAYVEGRRAATE